MREIVRGGLIAPALCPIFKEPLNYFFYGRPAYRLREQECVAAQVRAPVIFLFTAELIAEGKRVFPFDTGAFGNKRYSRWFHERSRLSDFELPAGESSSELHIGAFFETVADYFSCTARRPEIALNGNFEAEAVSNMLNDQSTSDADDRRVAVELQSTAAVSVHDPRLAAIILPKPLEDADYYRAFVGARVHPLHTITYTLQSLKRVNEYQSELERLASEFYLGRHG